MSARLASLLFLMCLVVVGDCAGGIAGHASLDRMLWLFGGNAAGFGAFFGYVALRAAGQ